MSYWGEEYTDGGVGTLELTDEQVARLVALIREHDGETDIEELELQEKYPDIYEALDEAYRKVAYDDEYNFWLIRGFKDGVYDAPSNIMEICKEKYGFEFNPDNMDEYLDENGNLDEDALDMAKREAFYEWEEEYTNGLCEDELVDFIHDIYGDDHVNMNGADLQYTIQIPDEIWSMANE